MCRTFLCIFLVALFCAVGFILLFIAYCHKLIVTNLCLLRLCFSDLVCRRRQLAFDFVSFVVRHRHFFRFLLMNCHGGFVFSPVGKLFEVGFPNAMSASAAMRATSLLLS